MRLAITHETVYRFDTPALRAIQTLRLTPRTTENQFVDTWRIDVSQDCRLTAVEDAFGNLTHTFSIDGPIDELTIAATGEVVTEDTAGVLHFTRERLPLAAFLRDTAATAIEAEVRAFADAIAKEAGGDRLTTLHRMMQRIAETITVADDAAPAKPREVLAGGRATTDDTVHFFLAAVRSLDVPARFVTGWRHDPKCAVHPDGCRWMEAWLGADLGWVAFDAIEDCCPTDRWVRLAVGLDALDTSAIRGVRTHFGAETMTTRVEVRELSSA